MIRSSCHCGKVSLEIDTAPGEITDCNCSICRRYGVLWAYYSTRQVRLVPPDAKTDTYTWSEQPKIAFHRCVTCGCVTHWQPLDPSRERLGINARLLPLDVLLAARIRHLDGAGTEEYVD